MDYFSLSVSASNLYNIYSRCFDDCRVFHSKNFISNNILYNIYSRYFNAFSALYSKKTISYLFRSVYCLASYIQDSCFSLRVSNGNLYIIASRVLMIFCFIL